MNSVSMMNTLFPGDFVLINKLIYGANTPNKITIPFLNYTINLPSAKLPSIRNIEKGDIVVINRQLPDRPEKYIKRCVAVSGQSVEIKQGYLYVDESPVDEEYLPADIIRNLKDDDIPMVLVPEGFIFVLGDNRNLSYDSRSFGFVAVEDVIGKAGFIYSSIDVNGGFRWSRFFQGVY